MRVEGGSEGGAGRGCEREGQRLERSVKVDRERGETNTGPKRSGRGRERRETETGEADGKKTRWDGERERERDIHGAVLWKS